MANDPVEEAAIIELIHRNRIAVWTNDWPMWERCFVHADYTMRMGWLRMGGIFRHRGWDDILERMHKRHPPARLDYAYDTRVENLTLRIDGNMAWATYEQIYPTTPIEGKIGPGAVCEARVFEKHDGEWKIAFLVFLDPNIGREGAGIMQLDGGGAILWKSPAVEAALAASDDLVLRNGRLRFRDTRADRRFQEHLQWGADADIDFFDGRQSRPIVVDAGEGEPPRIYWVVAEAHRIFLHIGSTEVSAERLDVAAAMYDLSPAQKRLAGHVAEGLSLAEIAERMGISANTARTHLNRIFDKTGVRAQPALVRMLLTAVAPV